MADNGGETTEVLVAVGRRPNSDDLGLESTDVRLDDDGFVIVDDRRTSDRLRNDPRSGSSHVGSADPLGARVDEVTRWPTRVKHRGRGRWRPLREHVRN